MRLEVFKRNFPVPRIGEETFLDFKLKLEESGGRCDDFSRDLEAKPGFLDKLLSYDDEELSPEGVTVVCRVVTVAEGYCLLHDFRKFMFEENYVFPTFRQFLSCMVTHQRQLPQSKIHFMGNYFFDYDGAWALVYEEEHHGNAVYVQGISSTTIFRQGDSVLVVEGKKNF